MPHPYLRRHFSRVQNGRFKAQSQLQQPQEVHRDPNWHADNYVALHKFTDKLKKTHQACLLAIGQTTPAMAYLLHQVSGATSQDIMHINTQDWLQRYQQHSRTNFARLLADAESQHKILYFNHADELFHADSKVRLPSELNRARAGVIIHCRWLQPSSQWVDEIIR